jgi:hypothetical protein
MVKGMILALTLGLLFGACTVAAQESWGGRAENLAAALDKTKYKKKEKRDITIEIYIDIKNTPAVLASPAEYSGRYICETGESRIDVAAAGDGSFTATGEDAIDVNGNEHGKFTIRDGRIDGAVLTGTRVFDSGQRQPFEAVFVNRTIRNGKNADEIATVNESFGLGYVVTNGDSRNRVFMEKK